MERRGRPKKWVIIERPRGPRGRPRKYPPSEHPSEPIPFHPERAYQCKYYNSCLNAAAFSKPSVLDCSGCEKRQDGLITLSDEQVWRHWLFLAAILRPAAFEQYCAETGDRDWGLYSP